MISTHVLDAVHGRPAAGMAVRAQLRVGELGAADRWTAVGSASTDANGRIAQLVGQLQVGVYRLTFDTEAWLDGETFYPEVTITVRVLDAQAHYHVPLLLSPYAYSTYRGS